MNQIDTYTGKMYQVCVWYTAIEIVPHAYTDTPF